MAATNGQVLAARDDRRLLKRADEALTVRNWALHCDGEAPDAMTNSHYVGQTADAAGGGPREDRHLIGTTQLCDRRPKTLAHRGAKTCANTMFTMEDVAAAARAASVSYAMALNLAECIAEGLTQSKVSEGGTNVAETGISFGPVAVRAAKIIETWIITLRLRLPGLSYKHAKVFVQHRLTIGAAAADDAGIVVRAAQRGMDGSQPVSVLQKLLSSEGGVLPSASPPTESLPMCHVRALCAGPFGLCECGCGWVHHVLWAVCVM